MPAPQPEPMESFDANVFSDFETTKSQSEHDGSASEKSSNVRRRTKAERMKMREEKKKPTTSRKSEVNGQASFHSTLQKKVKEEKVNSQSEVSFSKTLKTKKQSNELKGVNGTSSKHEKPKLKQKSSNGTSFFDNLTDDSKQRKKKMQNKNIRYNKNRAAKAEKNRKNHIAFLARNKVNKAKIVKFAQKIAASKIQLCYRNYLEEKKERERINFEQAQKR